MSIRLRMRQKLSLAILSLTITSISGVSQFASQLDAQQTQTQNPSPATGKAGQQSKNDSPTSSLIDDHSEKETADLGVLTASCPANAVCVKQVLQHSPADEAGIEAGDYLLAIDGKKVTSPGELNKVIASLARDKEVVVKVWRKGKEIECNVHLASKADELPKGQDAWLGVMLSNNKEGGIKIEHIVDGSPASRSKLDEGDILVNVNKVEIKDAQSFLEKIEAMGPEDSLQLTVKRNNEVRDLEVKLGSFCDAPMAFVRHLQSQHNASGHDGSRESEASSDLVDRAIDDMRTHIRELREEVRALKEGLPKKPAKPVAANQDGVTSLSNDGNIKYISQIQVQVPLRSFRQQNYNRGYNSYRNNSYFNRYSQSYSPYFNNGYSSQFRGNNYYYRSNQRPYYYSGNNNWYGNRPGSSIRIGPNLGVYWY
ncbi:MAG: PDZ domain-containing protein [Planctomycetota bacterium]|nr:PDZ domain-containing protein [Planctomycetota bacterium]